MNDLGLVSCFCLWKEQGLEGKETEVNSQRRALARGGGQVGKRGWPHAHAWLFCGSDFCSAPRGWAGVVVAAALTEIHVLGSISHPSASPESFIPLIGLNLFTFLHPVDGYLSMSHVNGAPCSTLWESIFCMSLLCQAVSWLQSH